MRKTLCAIGIVGLVALMGAAGAGAVDYPTTTGGLSVTQNGQATTTVTPGGAFVVAGSGCAAGVPVQVTFGSTLLTTVNTDATGAFSTSVTVPSSATNGNATITATGADVSGGSCVLTAAVVVAGASASILGLAFTGGNVALLAGVAAAVLAVGALFVGVTRRRSAHI